MVAPIDRRLSAGTFGALKGEVLRAAVELSDDQLADLTDGLFAMIRRRRSLRRLTEADFHELRSWRPEA